MERKYIGALPDSWKLERLNNVANLFGRIGWQGLTADEYQDEGPWLVTGTDFQKGRVNWDSCVHISEKRWEEAWQIQLQPNDLLITKDGTVGKLAIVEDMPGKSSLNSGAMRIVPLNNDKYSVKYLYYTLHTDVFTEWFKGVNAGASTIQHLFQRDFKHFVFPLPPLDEQRSIAKELDKAHRRSDDVAASLMRQISLLERYRASVVHEAVTRGLDPAVPTKPSGVDWIGEVPKDWNVKRLKYLFDTSSGSTPDGSDWSFYDGDINWVQSGDLYRVSSITETARSVTAKAVWESSALKVYSAPFVVMAMYGASVGNVAVCEADACTNQACCVMLPRGGMIPKYLYYVLLDSQMPLKQKALGGTQPNISQVIVRNHTIPNPPIEEQCAIADYLDKRTSAIDAVLDTKCKQLDVLKRRRQSLIYEYVTGKRRVTEEA